MKSIEIRIEDGESLLDALKRTVFESMKKMQEFSMTQ